MHSSANTGFRRAKAKCHHLDPAGFPCMNAALRRSRCTARTSLHKTVAVVDIRNSHTACHHRARTISERAQDSHLDLRICRSSFKESLQGRHFNAAGTALPYNHSSPTCHLNRWAPTSKWAMGTTCPSKASKVKVCIHLTIRAVVTIRRTGKAIHHRSRALLHAGTQVLSTHPKAQCSRPSTQRITRACRAVGHRPRKDRLLVWVNPRHHPCHTRPRLRKHQSRVSQLSPHRAITSSGQRRVPKPF